MPGGDGTGPMGQGSMTGRGMGYCAGFGVPGFMNPGFGRGFGRRRFGRGFGRGIGWRWRMPVQMPAEPVELSKSEQKKVLEAEIKELEAEKEEIKKELASLK